MTRCAGCGEELTVPHAVIDADNLPVCGSCLEYVTDVQIARKPVTDALAHAARRGAFRARYGEPGKGGK